MGSDNSEQQEQQQRVEWLRATFRRYERPLVRFAAHIVGDVDRARDVVQDTFFKLLQADPERLQERVAGWLFRTCRNRALDVIKKERRMSFPGDQQLAARQHGASSPAAMAEARQQVSEVLQVLQQLPDKQQEVVRLKLQAGLSYSEISEVTGHSVNHVGVLLHHALKAIRQHFAARTTEERRVSR